MIQRGTLPKSTPVSSKRGCRQCRYSVAAKTWWYDWDINTNHDKNSDNNFFIHGKLTVTHSFATYDNSWYMKELDDHMRIKSNIGNHFNVPFMQWPSGACIGFYITLVPCMVRKAESGWYVRCVFLVGSSACCIFLWARVTSACFMLSLAERHTWVMQAHDDILQKLVDSWPLRWTPVGSTIPMVLVIIQSLVQSICSDWVRFRPYEWVIMGQMPPCKASVCTLLLKCGIAQSLMVMTFIFAGQAWVHCALPLIPLDSAGLGLPGPAATPNLAGLPVQGHQWEDVSGVPRLKG